MTDGRYGMQTRSRLFNMSSKQIPTMEATPTEVTPTAAITPAMNVHALVFFFFFCGTIRTLQFVSFVGLLIHFSLFDSQIGLKYDNVIQNVEMEIAPMASNNKYCFKGKKKLE